MLSYSQELALRAWEIELEKAGVNMDAMERLRATVESLIEERDQLREDRDRLLAEAKDLMRERDNALAMAKIAIQQRDDLRKDRDSCIRISTEAQHERDEARQEAWRWRSLCCFTSCELESDHPFPWEEKS